MMMLHGNRSFMIITLIVKNTLHSWKKSQVFTLNARGKDIAHMKLAEAILLLDKLKLVIDLSYIVDRRSLYS